VTRRGHRTSPEELFCAKIVIAPNGCHLWTAGRTLDGYGKFSITLDERKPSGQLKQKVVRAHRYAFFLKHGRWPNENALHTCDEPLCVNADHLEDGDQSKNVTDCALRGRHGNKQATPELVREWRNRVADGERIIDIVRTANVAYHVVRHAVRGQTWKAVT
jgi:hypothetical protein